MAFTNKTAVAQAIGNNPMRVAELIERHLPQAKQDALEALIVPTAKDDEFADLLRSFDRALATSKREDAATARQWIASKLAELG